MPNTKRTPHKTHKKWGKYKNVINNVRLNDKQYMIWEEMKNKKQGSDFIRLCLDNYKEILKTFK